MSRKFIIYTGRSRKAQIWTRNDLTWDELRSRLLNFTVTGETLDEYLAMDRERQTAIKDVGGFVGGELRDGVRKKANLVTRSIVTLDFDGFTPAQLDAVAEQFPGVCWAVYSTHKHRPNDMRVRVVIPFSRDVNADEYEAVSRKVAQMIGFNGIDRTTFEGCRMMFWPSRPTDAEYIAKSNDTGEFLSPDAILGLYDDWRDPVGWPRTPDEQSIFDMCDVPTSDPRVLNIWRQYAGHETKGANAGSGMEDPTKKKGVVGAFCRRYGIAKAVDKFLSDRYRPYRPGRYTYIGASTVGGAVVYDDKWLFSNHATDPAQGREYNAYDLVRVHKFGHLDAGSRAKSVSALPSSAAMDEFCRADDEVREELAKESRERAATAFEGIEIPDEGGEDEADEWHAVEEKLLDKKGKLRKEINVIRDVILYHPHMKGQLKYNEFSFLLEIKNAPWKRQKDGPFADADVSGLRGWLENLYGAGCAPQTTTEAALDNASGYVRYHPVREYFDSLKWDGTKRLELLFTQVLGGEDNTLNRELSVLPWVGAVARIRKPGTKFDYCVTLYSPEGRGKSTVAAVMGGDWFKEDLATIGSKDSKQGLQGNLVIELAEMSAVKLADADAVKNFITTQTDRYRPSFGKRDIIAPRQCVFVATTNERSCLRGFGANRRFPVIEIKRERAVFKDVPSLRAWMEANRDQLWAEAVALYDEGHQLYLSDELAAEASARNVQYSLDTTDANFLLVDQYLEKPIPENWALYSAKQRCMYMRGENVAGLACADKDLNLRKQVCIPEIMAECFDIRPGTKDYASMARRIGNHMEIAHPEWKKVHHIKRDPVYGRARGWVRVTDAEEEDDDLI